MSDYKMLAEEAVADTARHLRDPDTVYRGEHPLGKTWAITFSKHRDSDVLERTNFEVISTDLQKHFPEDTDIERFSHWAVGWIEYLVVRMLDKQGEVTPAGVAAVDWQAALANYPVADDEAFSAAEMEDVLETLQFNYSLSEEEASRVFGLMREPISDFRDADAQQAIRAMRVEDLLAKGLTQPVVDRLVDWMIQNKIAFDDLLAAVEEGKGLSEPLLIAVLDWVISYEEDEEDFGKALKALTELRQTLSEADLLRIVRWAVEEEADLTKPETLQFVVRQMGLRAEDALTLPLFKGLGDIVDPGERRLWDAIALVATEAPSPAARAYAEAARDAVAEGGPEGLRIQLRYILSNLRHWRGLRAQHVKTVLQEYARPRALQGWRRSR